MQNLRRVAACLLWICLPGACLTCGVANPVGAAENFDLSGAIVVVPKNLAGPQAQAVRMLIEEVEKRSQVRWTQADVWPEQAAAIVLVGPAAFVDTSVQEHGLPDARRSGFDGIEGYRLRVIDAKPPVVVVAGNDSRGVLFGVGRLLRELRIAKRHIVVPGLLNIATAPKYPLRGHQLGYRPKTNSYDAWSVPMWEQYIRDLAVFGTNAVELLPPRTDDAADSPHFPLPPMRMMVEMSRLLDQYGIDVWVWYPAMDADYSKPATVQAALDEWASVIKQLPRVDAVFVPGGDPGHTDPAILMPFLEKQTVNLRRFHPHLQMWVSPQSFNQKWLDTFISYLKEKQPDWLSGVVYGPQVRISLPKLRALVPKKYPIRRYPDITHSRQCQYPVPDWDLAYASTESREVINPRPRDEAQIFRGLSRESIGFISYSEGCNDDVNKFVWSGLGWDPDVPVVEILRQYSRYFLNDSLADDFAHGLLALEQNWKGPLLTNHGVLTTFEQFRAMEKSAPPSISENWRFQQALYRAYYDAFLYHRLMEETSLEERALSKLRQARASGPLVALDEAEKLLDESVAHPPAPDLRARVFELGDMLFQSIRMQLSVERHKAIAVDRGATLDTIDEPLNNRLWLKRRFGEIRRLSSEPDQLREIATIVNWTDPGPGGFYDDLGNTARQPHLVRGVGLAGDPGFFETPRVGFITGRRFASRYPISWWNNMEALYDAPLRLHYDELDPRASYSVRIAYAGDAPSVKIRLLADEKYVVHPEMVKPRPSTPVEFDVPREATRDGHLTLTWYREAGLGGNGRGNAVAEVWLIKKRPAMPPAAVDEP
ncbi:MAG TPA: hypothetical protein VFG04_04845 [Planctomycetaceae bacterium]|jgi:hypothetical protein|nr:hypothetical protein [Planctomycetaceae bacterium]